MRNILDEVQKMSNIPMDTKVKYLCDEDGIFNKERKYVVPEYQRDYSWGEEQLKSFVESVRRAIDGEKVFMGTVQYARENNIDTVYDIIDGQQRMTTFILLLKVLGHDVTKGNNDIFKIKNFNGNDQKLVDALKGNASEQNKYVENLKYLQAEFEKNDDKSKDEMLNAINKNIYFVELITTGMSLPDVVGIFNTINTTGLDLNCTDIFKLRYYDYLHKQNKDEQWMSKICKIYDDINDTEFCNMSHVLDMYKLCLVAKYNLKWEKLSMGNEAFFEEILTGKETKKYKDILNFDEFEKIVYLYKDFHTMLCRPNQSTELINALKNKIDFFATNLIWETRYGWRYWTLPFVIAYFDKEENKIIKYANALSKAMEVTKYLIVCSVNYDKVINPVHTFMCNDILEKIATNGEITDIIKTNIRETPYKWDREEYPLANEKEFQKRLQKELFYNAKRSFIVCQLSALLDELNEDNLDMALIKSKLYNWKDKSSRYDMEHICPQNIFKNDKENIAVFNGIGNLVVFEQDKNRSVKDDKLKKSEVYPTSKYVSVKQIAIQKPNIDWTIDDVRKRAKKETKKISDFLGLEYNEV